MAARRRARRNPELPGAGGQQFSIEVNDRWRWDRWDIPEGMRFPVIVEDTSEGSRSLIDEYSRQQQQYNIAMMQLQSLVQRDLEDQISEELRNRRYSTVQPLLDEYLENQRVMSENQRESPRRQQLKITEVQALLKKGYTRYRKDDKGYGSIQEHYGLSVAQTKELFLHEGLKGLKTKFPGIEIIDDRPTGRTPTNSDTTTGTTTRNLFD